MNFLGKGILIVTFFSMSAHAEITVAFFSSRNARGEIVAFERGGKLSHVAIRYGDRWLHAAPGRKVELARRLDDIGSVTQILTDPEAPDLTAEGVNAFLGLPYDRQFKWENPSGTYCAKLIAQLLAIPPTPMEFNTPGWGGLRGLPRGELGISPDEIYEALLKRGYRERSPVPGRWGISRR